MLLTQPDDSGRMEEKIPAPSPAASPDGAGSGDDVGSPAMPATQRLRGGVHPALHVLSWIVFSNLTLLYNKYVIHSAGFRFPVLLTTWHLLFATLATQALAHFTPLLNSRRNLRLTPRLYIRTILPIGLLYSGSLVFSNIVYLYLSLAFVQMLKAAAPVAVLGASWAWGLASPSARSLANMGVIMLGVAIASYGEMQFSVVGFIFQVLGIGCEAVRLVMVQTMLSDQGMRMDPLVGLYYYAPVCFLMNLLIATLTEIPRFEITHLWRAGIPTVFFSAVVAFMLNVSSVFLIGKTSGLAITLTGIFKNILLVVLSVLIWQIDMTPTQVIGYIVALLGLLVYASGFGAPKPSSPPLDDLLARPPSWQPPSRDELRRQRITRLITGAVFVAVALLGLGSFIWTVWYLRGQGYTGRDATRFMVSWFGSR